MHCSVWKINILVIKSKKWNLATNWYIQLHLNKKFLLFMFEKGGLFESSFL